MRELIDVPIRIVSIAFQYKCLYGIQCIEDEMRVHLRLDGSDLGCVHLVDGLQSLSLTLQAVTVVKGNQYQEGQ